MKRGIGHVVAFGCWLFSCAGSTPPPADTTPVPIAPLKEAAPAVSAAPAPAPPPTPSATAADAARGVRMVRCEIKGTPVMPKDVAVWDSPHGGSAIASFAGQSIGIAAYEVAAQPGGRARIRTSGGIQVEGWVAAADLPLFAAERVPLVAGHAWIGRGQPLVVAVASVSAPEQLAVDAHLDGQVVQDFHVTAPCSALTLDRTSKAGWDVPGGGRGYVPRREQLDLYGDPGGPSVVTVHPRAPESSLLLWSTESRGGFVHVVFHDELILDAWARESDLVALKPGETMDIAARPARTTETARLAVSGSPAIARVSQDAQLRLTPQGAPVGVVVAGTEMYVIDTVLGWSSVLPRGLNLLPPSGRSFWLKASDLGGASK